MIAASSAMAAAATDPHLRLALQLRLRAPLALAARATSSGGERRGFPPAREELPQEPRARAACRPAPPRSSANPMPRRAGAGTRRSAPPGGEPVEEGPADPRPSGPGRRVAISTTGKLGDLAAEAVQRQQPSKDRTTAGPSRANHDGSGPPRAAPTKSDQPHRRCGNSASGPPWEDRGSGGACSVPARPVTVFRPPGCLAGLGRRGGRVSVMVGCEQLGLGDVARRASPAELGPCAPPHRGT